MKYEIMNPSDKCYIESENVNVACFCTLILGDGMYGLTDENNEMILPVLMSGGLDDSVKENIGNVEEFMREHTDDIINCFRSVEYPGERTSLNNIQKAAFEYADTVERNKIAGNYNKER